MTAQTEMFAPHQVRAPFCAGPMLTKTRAIAVDKPNTFTAKSKLDVELVRLLAAVAVDGWFPAVASAFPDVYWSDVFRDLLKARCRGLVAYLGNDRWGCA